MSKQPERRPFRAARTLQVVRDTTLGGQPVLLLGWWLGRDGEPEEALVLTLASNRRLSEITGLHGENPHQFDLLEAAGHG